MASGRTHRGVIAALIAIAAAMSVLWVSAAEGATVTVGSLLTAAPGGGTAGNNGTSLTVANTALPEPGTHVTSPVSGTIISWRAMTTGVGPYAIRVLRPAGGDAYTGAGTSVGNVDTPGDHTFTANLPIQAGDLLGLDLPNQQGMQGANTPGATFVAWIFDSVHGIGALPDGSTAAPNPILTSSDAELFFNAVVQYPDPATPKKNCKKKKKHKRSASSAKKKCKKKKKK
jgi:hypothetical protein